MTHWVSGFFALYPAMHRRGLEPRSEVRVSSCERAGFLSLLRLLYTPHKRRFYTFCYVYHPLRCTVSCGKILTHFIPFWAVMNKE